MIQYLHYLFAVDGVRTFDEFMQHLQQPIGIFDVNHVNEYCQSMPRVFEMLMRMLAPIHRKYPSRHGERTSFILTKTIGIVFNGHLMPILPPSHLLKIEKVLFKAFKVR